MAEALTFSHMRHQNIMRMHRWHSGVDWTLADWATAMAGEAGEACNIVKKIRRIETGLADSQLYNNTGYSIDDLKGKLAYELADLILYADILASEAGINLAQAVRLKFNEVSMAQGFPERL